MPFRILNWMFKADDHWFLSQELDLFFVSLENRAKPIRKNDQWDFNSTEGRNVLVTRAARPRAGQQAACENATSSPSWENDTDNVLTKYFTAGGSFHSLKRPRFPYWTMPYSHKSYRNTISQARFPHEHFPHSLISSSAFELLRMRTQRKGFFCKHVRCPVSVLLTRRLLKNRTCGPCSYINNTAGGTRGPAVLCRAALLGTFAGSQEGLWYTLDLFVLL